MTPLVQIWFGWQKAITRIEADLTTTVNDRATFGEFGEVVRANATWIDAHGGGSFLRFFARQCVRATVMGVRRHTSSKDKFSMTRLLRDMSKHASSINRSFYDSRFPLKDGELDWRTEVFSRVSPDGQTWSAAMIDSDLASLAQITKSVATFADKVIAHDDVDGPSVAFTYADLFQSVDRLDALFCRYHLLLKGSQFDTLRVGNPINLRRILSVPIVDPSNTALNPPGLRPAG